MTLRTDPGNFQFTSLACDHIRTLARERLTLLLGNAQLPQHLAPFYVALNSKVSARMDNQLPETHRGAGDTARVFPMYEADSNGQRIQGAYVDVTLFVPVEAMDKRYLISKRATEEEKLEALLAEMEANEKEIRELLGED